MIPETTHAGKRHTTSFRPVRLRIEGGSLNNSACAGTGGTIVSRAASKTDCVARSACAEIHSTLYGTRPAALAIGIGPAEHLAVTLKLKACAANMLIQHVAGAFRVPTPHCVKHQTMLGVNHPAALFTYEIGERSTVVLRGIPKSIDHAEQLLHTRGTVTRKMELAIES